MGGDESRIRRLRFETGPPSCTFPQQVYDFTPQYGCCRSMDGQCLWESPTPDGDSHVKDCQALCSASSECSAVSWYPDGADHGRFKCFLILADVLREQSLSMMHGNATKGNLAQCYVRSRRLPNCGVIRRHMVVDALE